MLASRKILIQQTCLGLEKYRAVRTRTQCGLGCTPTSSTKLSRLPATYASSAIGLAMILFDVLRALRKAAEIDAAYVSQGPASEPIVSKYYQRSWKMIPQCEQVLLAR